MKTATAVLREKYEMFKYDLQVAKDHIVKCEEKLKEAHTAKERVEKLIEEFDAALTKIEAGK